MTHQTLFEPLPDLPGYEPLELLYRSSHVLVYRALWEAGEQLVTIKVLRSTYPRLDDLTRFRHNYEMAESFDAPGVYRPLALEIWRNGYALVMEDSGGVSLDRILHHESLDLSIVLEVAVRGAELLETLQARRIVHRNLQPAHLLFEPQTRRLQAIDFSLAVAIPEGAGEIPASGEIAGCARYMAPEQTGRWERGVDNRSDFYSFGATLYELLTGQLPFPTRDPLALIAAHLEQPPIPPQELNPDLPPQLGAIALKLMAKKPEDRYQTAAALRRDCDRARQEWHQSGQISEFPLAATEERRDRREKIVLRSQPRREEPPAVEALDREKLEEIAQKEEQYRNIFECIRYGLVVTDLEVGRVIEINTSACKILGYRHEELLGRSIMDLLHPDWRHIFADYATTVRAGDNFSARGVALRKDGTTFDFEAKAALLIQNGQSYGAVAFQEIGDRQAIRRERERERTEQALRESQQRLRAFIDNNPSITYIKDIKGCYLLANPQYEALVSLRESEMLGKTDYDFFPAEVADKFRDNDRAVARVRHPIAIEEIIQRDGEILTYLSIKFPLLDETGNCYATCGISTDISDRKRTEITLREKSHQLERALIDLQSAQLHAIQIEKMASLGNLVAGVAHEINNPIGFLDGSIPNLSDYLQDLLVHLDLYRSCYPESEAIVKNHAKEIDLEFLCADLPHLLDSMQGAVDRIKAMTDSLRIFSRVESEERVKADLHEGLESTLLILKYRLKANEFRPAIILEKDYGSLPEIDCFPSQLNQVFMNILANAIDALDEVARDSTYSELESEPQSIEIQTRVVTEGKAVEIHIRDNGNGIPEELQSRIFDHLFTTKRVGKGTGLGLAIVRQIIEEKHGGTIEVQSQFGQGTEFCIRLPLGYSF